MRGSAQINARKKESKSYAPFIYGMRGDDISQGANWQMNLSQSNGVLEKTKQAEILKLIPDFTSIEYIAAHTPTTGEDQTLVFGDIAGEIKLRVLDSENNIITPATETVASATGTITATLGSNSIVGVGSAFLTDLAVDDYVQVDPGDGRVYQITEIISDTVATIDREYLGTTILGSTLKIYTNYGGTGDATFFGTVVTRQKGDYSLIGHAGDSKMWNGYGIVANSGEGMISMAHEGSRAGYITVDGKAKFTDNSPTDGFTGGTGANANGDYNCGLPVSTAIIEGGTGTVIFGERGAEAHWVEESNATDEVSSFTKIESFSYRGPGVKSERFLASTGTTIAFMNADGIFEMDPYSGKSVNLIIGGKIERYWKEKIDPSEGFVVYDQENDRILAQVALNSPGNNVFVAFNRRGKGMPPFIISDQSLGHAAMVGGKVVGGANVGGLVNTLSDGFAITAGTTNKCRYITEFDGLGSPQSDKNLQYINFLCEAAPDSNVKLKAYFDNETTASLEKTFTTKDLTESEGDAVYGEYTFALGIGDLVKEMVIRGEKTVTGKRFKTIAIEIWEESDSDFKIYDILVVYKSSNRLSQSVSLKHNLF